MADLLDRLRSRLQPLVGPELDVLWRAYRDRFPNGDMPGFLARLRRAGRLCDDDVTRLLLAEETTITLSGHEGPAPSDGSGLSELGKLGEGAMGEVWLATDPSLRRQVAVKRLRPHLRNNADLVRRFRAEAQITAQLDHPGILTVYGLSEREGGQLEYAMKLIRGRTLDDVLQDARVAHAEGSLPEELALPARLELFLRVCDAMSYAHERGVLHRDLKPENIMVGAFHEVTVMDWGIAKLIATEEEPISLEVAGDKANQTQLGLAIGTPSYMSPEQANGENRSLDGRSDQYALGLILSEIISLKRAVNGRTVHELLLKAQEARRDPPKAFSKREKVTRPLAAIVAKACALAPEDRYADVEALAADVRRYLRDEPVLAAPERLGERLHRWAGRHRTLLINAVLALCLLVVVGSVALIGGAIGVIEVNRQVQAAREGAARRVMGQVAVTGQRIDGTLLEFEGLVHAVAYATEQALEDEAEPVDYYLEEDFADPETAPPDLRTSPRYAAEVSLDHPIVKLAPGVSEEQVQERIHQLVRTQPRFWQVMVESDARHLLNETAARQHQIIGEEGVPVVWAIAAVEEGVLVGVPGKAGYPEGYDPRERRWYTGALATEGVFWDEPYVDASGMGLLVSCSLALRNSDNEVVGAAALDLDIDRLAQGLLAGGAFAVDGAEAFLVDRQGVIRIRSSLTSGDISRAGSEPMDPEVWATVTEMPQSTGMAHMDGDLVAWVYLASTGWTYVVAGPEEALLRGPGGYRWW